ncbi:MAG TPA: hypothetical protein VF407_20385 [Polyangiaceae bacterium]
MRRSLRSASPFALLAVLSIACGGSEPPPAPPPPPTPPPAPTPVIDTPTPVEDAGAPVAVATPAATPSFVAKRQGTIRDLAVDDRWTYWLTEDGDVKRAPSSGGPALKVEGFGATATGLVVFGGKMYTSAADPKSKGFSLLRADPNLANKPDVLATQAGTTELLAADRLHVVWGTATGKKLSLVMLTKDATKPVKLETWDATAPALLALSPANAYYADGLEIHGAPLATKSGVKKTLVTTLTAAEAHALGVTSDRIFVAIAKTAGDLEHEDIVALPIAGGDPVVVAKDQANVSAFVADDHAIYWTARGTKAAGFADGKIVKLVSGSNDATTLADKQRAPNKLALGDEDVTWTNDNAEDSTSDTDVLRLPK